MADVVTIFGILIFLGVAFPGLLTGLWLTLPASVERAQTHLSQSVGRCFAVGLALVLLVLVVFLRAWTMPSGVMRLAGIAFVAMALALAAIGAAGLAATMASQLSARANCQLSCAGAFVRSALLLELAAFFPAVGWLIVTPVVLTLSFGAAALALVRPAPSLQSVPGAISGLGHFGAGPLDPAPAPAPAVRTTET